MIGQAFESDKLRSSNFVGITESVFGLLSNVHSRTFRFSSHARRLRSSVGLHLGADWQHRGDAHVIL